MSYENEPTEQALYERARKRIAQRVNARNELITHIVIYLGVNLIVFGLGNWLLTVLRGQATELPGALWITFFWGMGVVGQTVDYWNKHGPGRERREQMIEREVERERARLLGYGYREKPKNDFALGDDGEIIEFAKNEQQRRRN
jgi:hypothetical protein